MINNFRVWCKNNNEWEKHLCFLSSNGALYHEVRDKLMGLNSDTHVVVRCVGVKDNSGNMIYEGDILQYFNDINNKRVVEFLNGAFMLDGKGIYHPCEAKYFKLYNIIGNIYENPKLEEWSK